MPRAAAENCGCVANHLVSTYKEGGQLFQCASARLGITASLYLDQCIVISWTKRFPARHPDSSAGK